MKPLDPVSLDEAPEGRDVHTHRVADEQQARARRECGEYFLKADIEIQGGEL